MTQGETQYLSRHPPHHEALPPCAHSLFEPRFESPTRVARRARGKSRGAREGSREAREREVRGAREGSSRRARGARGKSSGREWRFEILSRIVSFLYHIISSLQTRRTTRREQVARLFQDRGAGLSPCARNTIREAISRDTSSSQHAGHAVRRNRTRNAAGTFSGHCQRSRRICEQKCGWPSLSDDERRVQRRAVTGSINGS